MADDVGRVDRERRGVLAALEHLVGVHLDVDHLRPGAAVTGCGALNPASCVVLGVIASADLATGSPPMVTMVVGSAGLAESVAAEAGAESTMAVAGDATTAAKPVTSGSPVSGAARSRF